MSAAILTVCAGPLGLVLDPELAKYKETLDVAEKAAVEYDRCFDFKVPLYRSKLKHMLELNSPDWADRA